MSTSNFDQLFNEVREEINRKYDKTGGTVSGDMTCNNATITGTCRATNVYGAYWKADLAELFPCEHADQIMAGTAIGVNLKSENEAYTIASKNGGPVVGVKSEMYGFLLGGNPEELKETHVPVALAGVVPMLVLGPIKAGDKIGLSDIPGVGIKVEDDSWYGTALISNKNPGIYSVKAKVR